MPAERILYLVKLYFANDITEIQREELAHWIVQSNANDEIAPLLEKAWLTYEPETPMPADVSEKILAELFKPQATEEKPEQAAPAISMHSKKGWWKVAVAAASIIIFISGAYILLKPAPEKVLAKNNLPRHPIVNDVKPGGQKAILTLADGTQIILDSTSNGMLARQGNTQVIKLSTGEISYKTNDAVTSEAVYNTMSTPSGGLYQLVLPDGTKVWLNASSFIRYPTQFTAKERRVQVTGEAYFEVAKNAEKPFIVKINNDAEVKVVGTHFNINAYENEGAIKTTLLQGAVKVSKGSYSSLLKPGQQAQINKNGAIKKIDDADTDEAVAWKNGNFQFNSTSLQAVLRQAARWYDLEVEYKGGIPDDKFTGKISRSVNLSSLLKWMQWSEVHFKLEGKKLIVMP